MTLLIAAIPLVILLLGRHRLPLMLRHILTVLSLPFFALLLFYSIILGGAIIVAAWLGLKWYQSKHKAGIFGSDDDIVVKLVKRNGNNDKYYE